MDRRAEIIRNTNETKIKLSINLDGSGQANISTGIGFFDHMLNSFARHGFFDLEVFVEGDLNVDGHHTVEDVGIVLGHAILKAAGDKSGIKRYGQFMLPMDEALIACAVDLAGRPYLNYELKFTVPRIGGLDTELVHEFFYAVSYSAAMNLHLVEMAGDNNHHIAEAAFKAFARALDEATSYDSRISSVLSTKGVL